MGEVMYRIRWTSLITGNTGHGTRGFSRSDAERFARWLNDEHAGVMFHRAEPVEPTGDEPEAT